MLIPRVMPCLLLKEGSLVKTVRFTNPGYIGDPINAVRIYNQKEVDELIFLDITATLDGRRPPMQVLSEIASECFMPVTYGGGIRSLEDMHEVFSLGIEKIAINAMAVENPSFVREAAERFGNQSVVVSIDARKTRRGYRVFTHAGERSTKLDPKDHAMAMEALGAGEILLTSIEKDGTQEGYDLELIKQIAGALSIPVIASGGAGCIDDFVNAIRIGGASACAAGSMVVYYGRKRAVLISFPGREDLEKAFLFVRGERL